jgi:hypothetical protein
MILNFGSVEYVPSVLTQIAEWALSAKGEKQQSVVWIMPANILPAFNNAPALLTQLANLVTAAPHISHLAVFPGSSPLLDHVMALFRSVGVNTQRGAPDGACYAEVHKPDGSIVVGIPGPENEPSRDLDTLINDIADHKQENDLLELFRYFPTWRLFLPLVDSVPEDLLHGERITLTDEHVQFATASVQGLECAITFTSIVGPGLNPERMAMIDGREALQMVLKTTLDGLLIQSSTGYVVIQRKQIEQMLGHQSKPSLLDEVGRLFTRMFSKPKRK